MAVVDKCTRVLAPDPVKALGAPDIIGTCMVSDDAVLSDEFHNGEVVCIGVEGHAQHSPRTDSPALPLTAPSSSPPLVVSLLAPSAAQLAPWHFPARA